MFAVAKGVRNVDQKKALLLHTAGLSVQDIYFTLNERGTYSYQKVKATLNKYFKPQANVPYERLCFRETSQLANESIEQFVTRSRQKAQTCKFGDAAAVDEQIRDQVITKCLSHELRRKLLQKGRALTLPQLMITDAQREENSVESVMELDILRLCVKQCKTLAVEVVELEDHVDQMPEERMVRLTMYGK
ncbi:hypothetical protein ACROYT_G006656 [Oculina patagonica]